MSWNFDDMVVGGQLRVGTGICNPIKEGDHKINGSAHIEGPMVIGEGTSVGGIKLGAKDAAPANLMVTRCYNDDRDCFTPAIKLALQTMGNVEIKGDDGTPNALHITGNTKQIGNTNQTGTITASDNITTKADFIGAHTSGSITGGVSGKSAGAKPFDMPHPSKEGYRLRHTCPEGPSNDVYFRGKVRNKSTIKFPTYWKDLVDHTTITVNLTPIGAHQNVIVKRIDEDKIHLQAQGGMPINCHFHVFGTRSDIDRLTAEYQGTTPADYPGNNDDYQIAGYNKVN